MKINKIVVFIIILSLILAFILSNLINKKILSTRNILEETNNLKEESIEDEIKKVDIIYDWQIYIPKLNLYAPIKEGSTKEVLRSYVGHVEGTSFTDGNICLAAHNNTANYKSRNILL